MSVGLHELNEGNDELFVQELVGIFEHSPWVAERAVAFRPFASGAELYEKMVAVVQTATFKEQQALICAHPNLGARIEMSAESQSEQRGAGLKDLTEEEYKSFLSLNEQYMSKFSFPFIVAVKGKTKDDIYELLERRLQHSLEEEFQTALTEIYRIAGFRLEEKLGEPVMGQESGR